MFSYSSWYIFKTICLLVLFKCYWINYKVISDICCVPHGKLISLWTTLVEICTCKLVNLFLTIPLSCQYCTVLKWVALVQKHMQRCQVCYSGKTCYFALQVLIFSYFPCPNKNTVVDSAALMWYWFMVVSYSHCWFYHFGSITTVSL